MIVMEDLCQKRPEDIFQKLPLAGSELGMVRNTQVREERPLKLPVALVGQKKSEEPKTLEKANPVQKTMVLLRGTTSPRQVNMLKSMTERKKKLLLN